MIPDGTWTPAAIALGGNLGNVKAAFSEVLANLDADPGVRVGAVSSLWQTAPWGVSEQPDFLNAVALLETRYDASALLRRLQEEENSAGRERRVRWGPRPLDLDLLWFGREVHPGPLLAVPHPRMAERSFVLAPALEVARDWVHPATGESLPTLCEALVASGGWTRCVKADEAMVPCRS